MRLPNWLGDALMARPFLAALRRRATAARIVATGPAGLLELLAPDGAWDEVEAWPPRGSAGPLARPDVAFVLPPSFSSAWRAWRSGAAQRVGFASDGRSALLTRVLRRPPRGERHLGREYLDLLAPGDDPPRAEPLRTSERGEREAGARRVAAGLAGRAWAVLAPGAIYGPAKRWPVPRFAAVATALSARGMGVLACGGAGERDACEALAAAGAAVSLAGRTSLAEQAALCAGAAVVVSNDSGMAHLAAAVGAPTVAIFGSTSSAWTAPLGSRVRIVQRPPVCSPCFARTCRIGYRCLEAVSVRDVLGAIEGVAAGHAAGGAA